MALSDGAAIEAWAATARTSGGTPGDWTSLERNHATTVAVPLARGARLAALEVVLAEDMEEVAQQEAAGWLGATRVEVRPTTTRPRGALDWLPGATLTDKRGAALAISERAVLMGWLVSPDLNVVPAAQALATPAHSRLLETPAGQLLLSRARMDRSQDSAELGRNALHGATALSLAAVAADRDSEQDKLKTRLLQASAKLGGASDPIEELLSRARVGLTADAGDNLSASLALLAIVAERIHGTCPDAPCDGLERTEALAQAAKWSPQAASLAMAWRVVALKQAADTFSASYKRPSFGTSIMDIVDPLSGTGGGPVELSLLRYKTAEPTAILQISRLAGHPSTTDPDETLQAIHARLLSACDAALRARPSPAIAAELRKIHKRTQRSR